MFSVSRSGRKSSRIRLHFKLRYMLVTFVFGLGTAHVPAQYHCVEQQKLAASDAAGGDWFGLSVSVSGDIAVVGANQDNCTAGSDCGSAYVLRSNGGSWVQEQKLTANDAAEDDNFGWSVSVSGETVVVGAYRDDCAAGAECGSAYVFRFNGTSWVEEQKLTAADAAAGDWFGLSVSVSGETILVGANKDDCAAGVDCGSAYVYRFNGTTWVEEQKLIAFDADVDDGFGGSVSVDEDMALVGAPLDDCTAGGDCGAAYVFRFNGTSWDQAQRLTASDAMVRSFFGTAVSVNGETAVVGASGHACAAGDLCGSAYMFRFDGIFWDQEQKLTASDADANDIFGVTVTVNGDTAVVGAPLNDCAAGGDCGSAYVFRFNQNSWIEEQKLTATDSAADDVFGQFVSVSGNTVMVGAFADDCAAALDCGSVYVFSCVQIVCSCPAASTWGLVSAAMLLLAGGAFVIRRTANSPGSA